MPRPSTSTPSPAGKTGDTFTAGTLGKFTVGANKTVLLGDPYKFNKDNIDQFNF